MRRILRCRRSSKWFLRPCRHFFSLCLFPLSKAFATFFQSLLLSLHLSKHLFFLSSSISIRVAWQPTGDEGSDLPNRQTNLASVPYTLSLLIWHLINTTAYCLGRYEPSSPSTVLPEWRLQHCASISLAVFQQSLSLSLSLSIALSLSLYRSLSLSLSLSSSSPQSDSPHSSCSEIFFPQTSNQSKAFCKGRPTNDRKW